MTHAIDSLVQAIFRKNSLSDCSEQELQTLCDQYPYFAAPQLLLAQKKKADAGEDFARQLQKAILFFPSPLQADHFFNPKGTIHSGPKDAVSAATAWVEEPVRTQEEAAPITEPVTQEEQPAVEPAQETTAIVETATPVEEMPEEEMEEEANDDFPMEIPTLKLEPIDPATAELSFVPYHTVDYFASQGIKISGEEKTKDRFGQQLKSFTEWLKTIKKVPAGDAPVSVTAQPDQKVDQMAAHSLNHEAVDTEAMAEVWAAQGKTQKAIEIYQKLSLLNPSKSSYFASLIEQLKKS